MNILYKKQDWPSKFSYVLISKIKEILNLYQNCNIFLTGGRSAKELYIYLSNFDLLNGLENINFYFGDERIVEQNDENSNYYMVMKSLFNKNINKGCKIFPFFEFLHDPNEMSKQYTKILPSRIDILLLSMGDDGHIASIFPHSQVFDNNIDLILPIFCNKFPFSRLTITPKFINNSKNIYLFVNGKKKIDLFNKLKDNLNDYRSLPARLVYTKNCILIQ